MIYDGWTGHSVGVRCLGIRGFPGTEEFVSVGDRRPVVRGADGSAGSESSVPCTPSLPLIPRVPALPTPASRPSDRPGWRSVLVVLVVALVVRGGIAWLRFEEFSADPDAYRAIAITLAETGVFGLTDASGEPRATAFRPPLYPYLLSWLVGDGQLSSLAVATLHVLLGLVTVLCTLAAGWRLIGRASIVAALLVAVDPILLQQSTLVMTETLAAALASLVIWWWVVAVDRTLNLRSALLLGGWLALAFLCRPTFLVWAGLLVLAPLVMRRRRWRRRAGSALLIGAVMAITVAGWTVRNARAVGEPVWATTHGGYTLLLANNPLFYEYLRQNRFGRAWDAEPFLRAYRHRFEADPRRAAFWERYGSESPPPRLDAAPARSAERSDPVISETEDDELAYQAALATIRRQPGMFLWSCVVRAGRLWSPLPHLTPERSWALVVAVGVYYIAVYFAIAIAAVRFGRFLLRSPWWPVWTLAIALTAVHAVYWSNLRMRAPAVPAIALVAAAAVATKHCATRS